MNDALHNNKGRNPRYDGDNFADAELLSRWCGPAILLVDLDAFFAAVEQLDHPAWRGKPVIVGGDADKRGVVSTASYEARVFGVRSAMAASTANSLCPNAIWTHGNHARYKEMSAKVMDILNCVSPFVQQVSIDEAFVDVSPTAHNTEHPVNIARWIQKEIEKLGISASIGIGSSKTIAKIASDMDKPRGITVVYPGRETEFLSPLPVRALSGIGASGEARLHQHGIETLGDIVSAGQDYMVSLFGKNGNTMFLRASGMDDSPIDTQDAVKSVSHEISFASDLTQLEEVSAAIHAIASKVGRRLRAKGLKGHTISVKIRYDDRSLRNAQRRLDSATDDDLYFAPIALELLNQLWTPGIPVRLLGIAITGFDEKEFSQEQLFDFDEISNIECNSETLSSPDKRVGLLDATDKLKDRFGENAVQFGYELKTSKRITGSGSKNPSDYRDT
ncbi:MAG: DNA polymerase IV [Raoultibacter sp.]|jgi:DNA polymerase-4